MGPPPAAPKTRSAGNTHRPLAELAAALEAAANAVGQGAPGSPLVKGAAAGLCPSQLGTHCLRIGGATAFYKAGYDIECIKRLGRWASNAVHNYLWETHERQRGLSARMVEETGALTTAPVLGVQDQRDGEENKRQRLDTAEARVRWVVAA